jgi:hypothetical protein
VVPEFAPGFPLAGGDEPTKWSRFTGTVLPGGVLWFTDDLIPASGANNQLLVSAPDQAMVLCEGQPVLALYPQTGAASAQVTLHLWGYAAAIPVERRSRS